MFKTLISHNEGGRGLVYTLTLYPFHLYICYWTKIIAPRLSIMADKIEFSLDP